MTQDIRASIYQSEFLDPHTRSGYSIDTFYYRSNELAEYSAEQLEGELKAMVVEGLLYQEDDSAYYWGTADGRIARQRYLAQKGYLTKPLVHQCLHGLESLLLAIAASGRVDPFSADESIARDALPIILCDFSEEEIRATTETLIKAELLKVDSFHPREGVYITGRGLHKYKKVVHLELALAPDEGILRIRAPVEKDARFGQLGLDIELQDNLAQRWIDMEACAEAKAYLPAVIMLGSILEGALLAKLRANVASAMKSTYAPKDKGRTTKTIEEWTLADSIAVAVSLGYIPRSVEKHSQELRDTRNLVHPGKQVKERILVDASLYRISKEVAETVIDALSDDSTGR